MISKKIALLFPGVGSQQTGMCKDFISKYSVVKDTFVEASDILNIDMIDLCLSDSKSDLLNELEYSQLSLLTVSTSLFRIFKEVIGIEADFFVGHSLGEYSALVSNGIFSFRDALNIVKKRGEIINDICQSVEGTMAWVVNIDSSKVHKICNDFIESGIQIYVSAYNAPMKTAISGKTKDIIKAAPTFEKSGAIVLPLGFKGPFHSPLMGKAVALMKSELIKINIEKKKCNVISIVTGDLFSSTNQIIENLANQLASPIQWNKTINVLLKNNVSDGIELGPKEVLKFLVKDITNSIDISGFEIVQNIETIKNKLIVSENSYLYIFKKCLGAIVSTKNSNSISSEYSLVIDKYKEIEQAIEYYDKKMKMPTKKEVIDILDKTINCMQLKKVSKSLIERKIQNILENKILA